MTSFLSQLFSCFSGTADLTDAEQLEADGLSLEPPPAASPVSAVKGLQLGAKGVQPPPRAANPLHTPAVAGDGVGAVEWDDSWGDENDDEVRAPKQQQPGQTEEKGSGGTEASKEQVRVEQAVEQRRNDVEGKVWSPRPPSFHLRSPTKKQKSLSVSLVSSVQMQANAPAEQPQQQQAEEEEVDWFADMTPQVVPAKKVI